MTTSPQPSVDPVLLQALDVHHLYAGPRGLFRSSPPLAAVSGVSLNLKQGAVLGLVGESGCGKSTLAKILLGLILPTRGTVKLAGQDIASLDRIERARLVQAVFQDPHGSLNPSRTIGSSIILPLAVRDGKAKREHRLQVCELLERVGLSADYYDRYPAQLSGGQRQRAAIARALIANPSVLVCDEPTSALDVSVQAQILNLLEGLRKEFNLTYVLISHNLAVVEHLATDVAVMYRGRIVEQGETEEVFARPAHPYTRALLASALSVEPSKELPALPPTLARMDYGSSGCAFAPRCPIADAACRSTPPDLRRVKRVMVACHMAQ